VRSANKHHGAELPDAVVAEDAKGRPATAQALLWIAAVLYTRFPGPQMKPPPFQYHDPRTLAEALTLLDRLENAKLLAGGQSLMPMLNMRLVLPDHVIDLNRVEGLSYIKEVDGALEIGAMTRQYEVEFSEVVQRRCPLLHRAILHVGHRQTRNRGTVGGSLCHLDPAAELVAVAAALDATVAVAGPGGGRVIKFPDFPAGYMTPAIAPNEIVTAVRFPLWSPGHGAAFVEFARRHGDFAIVAAAAVLERDGTGRILRAAVTLGGIAAAPVRMTEVERAITGQAPHAELFRDACECCRKLDAIEDIHAPASYRQHLAAVLARRALEQAAGIARSQTGLHPS
jgi:carbon-monoxide dehydrogenase medium subunit